MSQASRRHVEALKRQRAQVAVFVDAGARWTATDFDAAIAREAAEALVRLGAEQDVFEDWCRERGLGPDNREPGAFGMTDQEFAMRLVRRQTKGLARKAPFVKSGGWPGRLAREWPGDPRAPMGRSMARLGRRVLEALEGQPAECQASMCTGGYIEGDNADNISAALESALNGGPSTLTLTDHGEDLPKVECPDCKGTGHNLPPALEVSPQLRRRYFDSLHAAQLIDPGTRDGRVDIAQWMRRIQGSWIDPGSSYRTRVVPRGTHRTTREGSIAEPLSLDERITGRAEGRYFGHQPKWRRGEFMHARQQAERRSHYAWLEQRGIDAGLARVPNEPIAVFNARLPHVFSNELLAAARRIGLSRWADGSIIPTPTLATPIDIAGPEPDVAPQSPLPDTDHRAQTPDHAQPVTGADAAE